MADKLVKCTGYQITSCLYNILALMWVIIDTLSGDRCRDSAASGRVADTGAHVKVSLHQRCTWYVVSYRQVWFGEMFKVPRRAGITARTAGTFLGR